MAALFKMPAPAEGVLKFPREDAAYPTSYASKEGIPATSGTRRNYPNNAVRQSMQRTTTIRSTDPRLAATSKAILLGAGKETSHIRSFSPSPRCLALDSFGARALDWTLSALRSSGISEVAFVGGYRIDEIAERYPELRYVYNPEWHHLGVLSSLFHARDHLDVPTLVAYSDVTYRPSACTKLIQTGQRGITVAIDTTWRSRAGSTTTLPPLRKNMVFLKDGQISQIGFLAPHKADAEFVGMVHLGIDGIAAARDFFDNAYLGLQETQFEQAPNACMGYLTDLIAHLIRQGVSVSYVDIGATWTELDSPQNLARFVLGTKAETLDRLGGLVKTGRFCSQEILTLRGWLQAPQENIRSIRERFGDTKLVVRSSTFQEDSWTHSCAGSFESILNVLANADALTNAIDRVVASYSRDGLAPSPDSQILIQEMVQDVAISGVIFTRDLATGAPYYSITYDDTSQLTDTVTSGSGQDLKHVTVSRNGVTSVSSKPLAKLIAVVDEIERVSGCSALDIEFCITQSDEVYILQVRPMTLVNEAQAFSPTIHRDRLASIKTFVNERLAPRTGLLGSTTVLADMPDWNPAEMIGSHPRPLARSLYNAIITRRAWHEARARIGYRDVGPTPLMVVLGGHPYIDVRASFNSFLPARLPEPLAAKLVEYYLTRLQQNPTLHDKIEFEICATCLDLNFNETAERLACAGFDLADLDTLKGCLRELTVNIVTGQLVSFEAIQAAVTRLGERRERSLSIPPSADTLPMTIDTLLEDCVEFGTIPFSVAARYGFIAQSFLNSLIARKLITVDERNSFLHSIETVASEMVTALDSMQSGALPLEEFLKRFGHLRPGTYDINSLRYADAPELYFGQQRPVQRPGSNSAKPEFTLSPEVMHKIDLALSAEGFTFDASELFAFMRQAIPIREWAKFEFTKSVSAILELLAHFGGTAGFSREELSYLDIESIRKLAYIRDDRPLTDELREAIEVGADRFESEKQIILPHLICGERDVDVIVHEEARPNYVTALSVTASVVPVGAGEVPPGLQGAIAVIEGADPGYDWLFAHGIAGLVTKYGGAGSHMTIRAAEFGIPAAVGCGELLFERVRSARVVELNSREGTIRVV